MERQILAERTLTHSFDLQPRHVYVTHNKVVDGTRRTTLGLHRGGTHMYTPAYYLPHLSTLNKDKNAGLNEYNPYMEFVSGLGSQDSTAFSKSVVGAAEKKRVEARAN
ncbi:hypothetical protein B0H16DRAFT_1470383 [Mycena metata]|uniref:Uncharacterized protein n=1 Tax=Mycena metata TaxID=1033252 RepID=A0AAD7HW16_9AGAR|nr:hypothetical protein B0H16DRAFT_1470383 [Mycena metata]